MVAVYGWGIVAPGAPNIQAFLELTHNGQCALRPAGGGDLGRGLFFVGDPTFDFAVYQPWFEERSAGARFAQLQSKMGKNALFAIGAVIQALESNPGLERAIRQADDEAHVYIGSGLGDLTETCLAHGSFELGVRAWNRFWSAPSRCQPLRAYLQEGRLPPNAVVPPNPESFEIDSEERFDALREWNSFWALHSEQLAAFVREYSRIEATPVGSDDERAAIDAIRNRQRQHRDLLERYGCPVPPWNAVDPRLLWAIQNVPAAQVSILLGTHGPAWAPVGACATFGIALKLGCDAIARGEAKVVIVGTCDSPPLPMVVSAFHRARLTPATGSVSHPFGELLGTHISGGACIWVLGEEAYMQSLGLPPIGPAIVASTVSSDAFHIITPAPEGPKHAIRAALAAAGARGGEIAAWDLHATGTPGDVAELKLIQEFIGPHTAISARKGLFGHGMANAGGWELTAVALGMTNGIAPPTGIEARSVHPLVRGLCEEQLVSGPRQLRGRFAVKVMLGIGGVTSCVVLKQN